MQNFLKEQEYCDALLTELNTCDSLQLLTKKLTTEGITVANKPFLFELRFAKFLIDRGVTVAYEVKTVEETTVDFQFTAENKAIVLAELVSINTSDAVTEATQHKTDEHGIIWSSLILQTNNDDPKFSEEGEVLLVQQKICEKVFRDGKPIKFPHPTENKGWNVLIVDMRGFLGGLGGDNANYVQLCMGNNHVNASVRKYWTFNGVQRSIMGLFEDTDKPRGALTLRERVHAIVFTKDTDYMDGSLMDTSFIITNPHLIKTDENHKNLLNVIKGIH